MPIISHYLKKMGSVHCILAVFSKLAFHFQHVLNPASDYFLHLSFPDQSLTEAIKDRCK